jgi:hypothetical protein
VGCVLSIGANRRLRFLRVHFCAITHEPPRCRIEIWHLRVASETALGNLSSYTPQLISFPKTRQSLRGCVRESTKGPQIQPWAASDTGETAMLETKRWGHENALAGKTGIPVSCLHRISPLSCILTSTAPVRCMRWLVHLRRQNCRAELTSVQMCCNLLSTSTCIYGEAVAKNLPCFPKS